jgi:Phosphatase
VSRARIRPPKLEPREGASRAAPPPTLEELLERAKIAGAGSGPGRTELRHIVEGVATAERRALGELVPIPRLTPADAWLAVKDVFGATADTPMIDAARTIAATRTAAARVRAVAASGARVAIATAHPASLMMLHLAFARCARSLGGEVVDLADFGPIRADGRTPRWLRWVGGVAVVSDGDALCAVHEGEAAREWTFAIPRPSLVIADGPFAEVAWEAGIEVVALMGLDRPGLAVAAARSSGRSTLVPMRTDRPARAYGVLEKIVERPGGEPDGEPDDIPDDEPRAEGPVETGPEADSHTDPEPFSAPPAAGI